jgi:hypothetical protein
MYSHREDSSVFPRPERGSSSVLQVPSLGPWWRLFLIFLVLCAAAEFAWRGPVRFVHSTALNDFTSPYIQSKALLKGLDPYSPENLVKLWPEGSPRFVFLDKELADGSLVAKRGIPTAYPLTCLLLLAPFAVLPWKAACAAWLALLLTTVFMLAWSMIELSEPVTDEGNVKFVVLAYLLGVAVTLSLAWLSWIFFEEPLIRRGRAYTY